MFKRLLTASLLAVTVTTVLAQGYAVDKIPAELKDRANVVKRMERIQFVIINSGHTILKKQYALTILNEQGAVYSGFAVYYSKLSSLKSFTGTLYDASGREIQKIKWKDLKDESAVSGSNLMDDYRIKRYELYHRDYPYTIVYESEEENNNSLFFEDWQPVAGEKYAVEQSAFTITYPIGTKVRYSALNYGNAPQQTTGKGTESLSWEIKQLKAIKYEPLSKSVDELTPTVLTGPEVFQIEGYQGNMATWKSFGQFVYTLTKDRQELPSKVKQDVQALTKSLSSEYDKIAVLYNYLQKNTRYISIQLGLGGWQPFDAAYVAKNAYGDCKALVNYMRSLLNEVGIASDYTLIRAGNNHHRIITDLPSQQFNHVILCVPLKQDTVWLECTSQTLPMGYLSAFTENRYALLVNEDGGKLVHTPKYGLEENKQLRYITADLDENGDLKAQIKTIYSGLQQDDVHDMINYLTSDKIQERLNKSLPLATYKVVKFSYDPQISKLPSIKETLEVEASGYAHTTGKRLMIAPNILSKRQGRLSKEIRTSPIVLDFPYVDLDTIQIHVPSGYRLEAIPDEADIQSKFGAYNFKMELKNNKIYCYRTFKQFDGEYPASDYEELAAFYDAVHRADRKQVIMAKSE